MNRFRLALGLSLLVALAIPTVAFASSRITFSGSTNLIAGPGTTSATFRNAKDGSIRSVVVKTEGEGVTSLGGIMLDSCAPSDSPFCSALEGASFSSLHDSRVTLSRITQVPGAAVGLPFPDVLLVGSLKGSLQGNVLVGSPGGAMGGTMKLRIRSAPGLPAGTPTAVYGCLAPGPVTISVCKDGLGALAPLALNIQDSGEVKFDTTFGEFDIVSEASAKVKVTIIDNNPFDGFSGIAVFSKGKAELGDEGVKHKERDREGEEHEDGDHEDD